MVTVRASTIDDTAAWRSLARTVEHLFGAAMADADGWNESLVRNIERGTAWCAVDEHDVVLGGVWMLDARTRRGAHPLAGRAPGGAREARDAHWSSTRSNGRERRTCSS